MNRKPSIRVAVAGLVGLALALSVGLAPASQAEETVAPATTTPPSVTEESTQIALPIAGMMVSIDPKTGRLRQPTPEEAQQLAAAMARSLATRKQETRVLQHRDGMLSAVVGIDYAEYANFEVATIGADGSVEYHCTEGQHEADSVLIGNQVAQPTAEEK